MLWILLSCGDVNDCTLSSDVPSFIPDCDTAQLVRYAGESRLAIGGSGGVLTLYLPEDLDAGTIYGGTSGNALLSILSLSDREEIAFDRTSTMTIAQIGPAEAELQLSLDFDSGAIEGPLQVPVLLQQ